MGGANLTPLALAQSLQTVECVFPAYFTRL